MKTFWKPGSVLAAVGLGIGTYAVLNTRLGVHLALDVFSEIGEAQEAQTAAADGPLTLTAQLAPVATIPLPPSIEQPSGIKHRNGAIYISTDQTEIFKLDSDFTNPSEPTYLLGGPLLFKQGALEGIEVRGDRLFAIGEFGTMPTWQENGTGGWARGEDTALPESIAETEFSGITDSPRGRFATSESGPFIINLDDGTINELVPDDFLKQDADLTSLALSGIAYHAEDFYLLSETHTSIIVVDANTFRVKHVFGIAPCAAADLSIHEGRAYIVIDHNDNQEVEPVMVYDLETTLKQTP